MMKLKHLSLFLFLTLLISCKTQSNYVLQQNPKIEDYFEETNTAIQTKKTPLKTIASLERTVELLEATVSPHYDQESGMWTQDVYTFTLQINEAAEIDFPTIWIGEQSFIQILGKIQGERKEFKVGEIHQLTIVVPVVTDEEIPIVPIPDVCKNCKALIEVNSQGKIAFVRIREVSKLE